MAYPDFKSYIQENFKATLTKVISEYVNANHDAHGFHSINVLSLCEQKIDNLVVKSLRCNDLPGAYIKIDINLTADIVTMGLGTTKYEAGRKTRWFTVHTKALLRDGMQLIEDEIRTEEYAPGTFDKTTALDEFMVPYIYTADLEDIADDFFEFYCQNAIYLEGYTFPYGQVLNEMDIGIYEADLPETTMGRMYFQKDKATVYHKYPYVGEVKQEDRDIEPGTMLISKNNYFMYKTGSAILTITHEIVHWYYHQKFFKILALLDSDAKVMNCDVEPHRYDENMSSLQKAMWFAEWQANAIGFRIAMPQQLFIQAMVEAREVAIKTPRKGSWRGEVLEDIINRVAKLFGVSVFAAKQRAIQLGCDIAAGTHIYIDGRYHAPFSFEDGALEPKQTFTIDKEGLEEVCKQNKRLAELINSGKFVYLGYVVCINDDRFIKKLDDSDAKYYGCEYGLNDYGRDHVDECCLIFNWESISGARDDGGFYGQCYLSKDVSVENRIEHTYDSKFESNQTTESLAEQIAKYKAIFKAEDDILSELHSKCEFPETLIYHMDRKKIKVEELAERSGLSVTTIKKYRAGTSRPDLENMMAILIGLNLPEKYCDHMLATENMALQDKNMKQKVYRILIREHSDGNIHQWNEILQGFGLETIPNQRNQKINS